MGEFWAEEEDAAFPDSDEEEEVGGPDVGGVHMLTTAAVQPGPVYWWGRVGSWEAFIKIMNDSGNIVSNLISEEFADRLGLEGEAIEEKIEVPTAAAANTLRIVKRCWGVPVQLVGIAGEFVIQPLVVRGLTHLVSLGQHFLGCYILGQPGFCIQLCIRGQAVQLVGHYASWPGLV